jgi:hypothetical protein
MRNWQKKGKTLRSVSVSMFPILLKFSEPHFLEAFRNEGLLYMNTLKYFRELEGDAARGDSYKGVSHMIQPHDIGEFTIDSGIPAMGRLKVNTAELGAAVRISKQSTLACNLFCMFAITKPIDCDIVAPEHRDKLGSAVVLVLNSQEFLARVAEAGRKVGLLELEGRLVEYYDGAAYSGEVGPFRKRRAEFQHQSEYRIVVRPGLDGPRVLTVGNLRDITSEILPSAEINDRLDFSTKSAREAGLAMA